MVSPTHDPNTTELLFLVLDGLAVRRKVGYRGLIWLYSSLLFSCQLFHTVKARLSGQTDLAIRNRMQNTLRPEILDMVRLQSREISWFSLRGNALIPELHPLSGNQRTCGQGLTSGLPWQPTQWQVAVSLDTP